MIFIGKRSGILPDRTMTVKTSYKYAEKIAGGISWYMMDTKDFISSNIFILKMKLEI